MLPPLKIEDYFCCGSIVRGFRKKVKDADCPTDILDKYYDF